MTYHYPPENLIILLFMTQIYIYMVDPFIFIILNSRMVTLKIAEILSMCGNLGKNASYLTKCPANHLILKGVEHYVC